jgi:hypothetical protein
MSFGTESNQKAQLSPIPHPKQLSVLMGRLSRKYNSSRVMKKTVEREREREREVGQFGDEGGISHIPCRNLGAS